MNKPPLTAKEAALVLGVSVHTVNDLVRLRRLRILTRVGTKRLFHPDDVERVRVDRERHPRGRDMARTWLDFRAGA